MAGKDETSIDNIIEWAESLKTQFNQAQQPAQTYYQPMSTGKALGCMERIMEATIELAKEVKRLKEEKTALEERVEELEAPKTVKLSKTPTL